MNRHTLWILFAQHALLLPVAAFYLLRGRRDARTAPSRHEISRGLLAIIIALFALVVFSLAHWWDRGILWGDESAYRFQAKAYAAGHIGAVAPGPTSLDESLSARELHFTHHIIRNNLWFTKYPPLWPAVLALGELLRMPWIVNPTLALLLALVIAKIGRDELDLPAPRLAVAMLLSSPFFFLMAASQMSHVLAALLVALSAQQMLQGVRANRFRNVAISASICAVGLFGRPFSAACVALPLAGFALHAWRRSPARLLQLALLGVSLFLFAVFGMAIQNETLTGSYAVSPYALYRGTKAPIELSFSLSTILENLRGHARWSLVSTILYSFPFVYLLAFYGVWSDRSHRVVNLFLAAFPVILWGGHLINTEGSSSRFGDRYVFESFFAVVLLASRGFTLFCERHGLAHERVRVVLLSLLAVQGSQALGLSLPVLREISPYVEVHDEIIGTHLTSDALVYLTVTPSFTGDRFNVNDFDWRSNFMVLVDPGEGRREEVARSQERSRWMVLTYDDHERVPRWIASGRTDQDLRGAERGSRSSSPASTKPSPLLE